MVLAAESINLNEVSNIELYDAIVDNIRSAVIAVDKLGKIRFFNRSAERLFGYESKEVIGSKYVQVLHSSEISEHVGLKLTDRANRTPLDMIATEKWSEISIVTKNNAINIVEVSSCLIENGTIHRLFILDELTELIAAENEIQSLALRDPLTKLPNRTLMSDRLAHAIAESDRYGNNLAVFFLDLDLFKKVNDSLGHSAGDKLLINAARRIKDCLRGTDTLARIGGDEFVVILSGFKNNNNIPKVAMKILKALSEPFPINANEVYISGSIGIATYPDDGKTTESLLRSADIAMYAAKDRRGNTYQFFSDKMNKKLMYRLEIETALRRAIEKKDLYIEFQAKVDLVSRKTIGAEVLLRWGHPEKGNIPPSDFIPIAEETGLICQIGEYVLREACKQFLPLATRTDEPLELAVNLSGRQFEQPNLLAKIQNILSETNFPSSRLVLEITETTLMENADVAADTLEKLRELGIKVSVDDFGTGYSSLGYLQNFPIDQIKIDRSFVSQVTDSTKINSIINTIIQLGKNLSLELVAEGVETEEQLEYLLLQGCRYAQGFLFAKPERFNIFSMRVNKTVDKQVDGNFS